jgi:biotin transport system permease protein
MNIYDIDRISVLGTSLLHRLPAWVKMLALAALITVVLSLPSLPVHAGILLAMIVLALLARVPMGLMLGLTAYPLIFLIIIFFSVEDLTLAIALGLSVRVLAITAGVILLLLTTSYPAIFAGLGRVLPAPLVAALFFTYRSLFILAVSLSNMRTALHLRGGLEWKKHPLLALRNLGLGLGHLLVHAIEISQRMADSLTVRGFHNRIYTLGRFHVRDHR